MQDTVRLQSISDTLAVYLAELRFRELLQVPYLKMETVSQGNSDERLGKLSL